MSKPKQLSLLVMALLLGACQTDNQYPYAIKDFRKALQPHLTHIVSKGIVQFYDTTLDRLATNKELIQLEPISLVFTSGILNLLYTAWRSTRRRKMWK